jgi:hypothetical protein
VTTTQSLARFTSGCADVNENAGDLEVVSVAPRNGATTAVACGCAVRNESDLASEADYCNTQFPTMLSVATGTPNTTFYGRIFEAGTTESGGASPSVRAQFGFGSASVNPQYQSYAWTNATFNTQVGNDDEYQATITAPAVGEYRTAFRMSLDRGLTWTVCDANGSGSNPNLTFALSELATMSVGP